MYDLSGCNLDLNSRSLSPDSPDRSKTKMTNLTVPENLRFDRAIELSQTFLLQLKNQTIAAGEITPFVSKLVATENGARGFFVTYFTLDDPICDEPQPEIMAGLAANPEIIADLLVKNLAMSVAQQIYHRRNQDPEMAASSATVTRRTLMSIDRLDSPRIRELAAELHTTIDRGEGSYTSFLERWKYDTEQKEAIAAAVSEIC
jgi:hypothetical protein